MSNNMSKEIILNDGSSILCYKFTQAVNFITITKGRVLEEIYTDTQIYTPEIERMSIFTKECNKITFGTSLEKYKHKQLKEVENVKVPYSSVKYIHDIPENYIAGDLTNLNYNFQIQGKDEAYAGQIIDVANHLIYNINLVRKTCGEFRKYRKSYTLPVDQLEMVFIKTLVRDCFFVLNDPTLETRSIDILKPINYDEFNKNN